MRIFFNKNRNLPYTETPLNPEIEFSFGMGSMLVRDTMGGMAQFRENAVWPMLHGLKLVDAPLLAHLTSLDFYGYGWYLPSRFLIQVTTCPTKTNRSIPSIVEGGRLVVEKVWRAPTRTLNTPESAWSAPESGQETIWTWRNFFEGQFEKHLQPVS